mmetsp:Transcript_21581/g.59998  ORF Transcript_21581/g.59998 Transcript_21581/m.59998 type:complete len:231 (+) Transcript_21581:990-1682(+)
MLCVFVWTPWRSKTKTDNLKISIHPSIHFPNPVVSRRIRFYHNHERERNMMHVHHDVLRVLFIRSRLSPFRWNLRFMAVQPPDIDYTYVYSLMNEKPKIEQCHVLLAFLLAIKSFYLVVLVPQFAHNHDFYPRFRGFVKSKNGGGLKLVVLLAGLSKGSDGVRKMIHEIGRNVRPELFLLGDDFAGPGRMVLHKVRQIQDVRFDHHPKVRPVHSIPFVAVVQRVVSSHSC